MEKNFTDIAEKIEQRRSAIIKALTREAEAIKEAEATLSKHYKDSVKDVCNGLVSNMEVQGKELFKDFKKSNDQLRMSIIKTRGMFLKILLPTALLIGVIIGMLVTYYLRELTGTWIRLENYEIQQGQNGTNWIEVTEILKSKEK